MLVSNIVLSKFLGICPYLGVSKKTETAIGMSFSVLFVMVLASSVTFIFQKAILDPLNLGYLQTIIFILIIAALVQMVEIILKKTSSSLYNALGIYLPLITTNCAILGVAILNIQKNYNFIQAIAFTVGSSLGFGLALLIFSGLRERLDLCNIPESFKGAPIALITAGLVSLAFMGFSGLVKG
jgi:electron transport complex protein RnfA